MAYRRISDVGVHVAIGLSHEVLMGVLLAAGALLLLLDMLLNVLADVVTNELPDVLTNVLTNVLTGVPPGVLVVAVLPVKGEGRAGWVPGGPTGGPTGSTTLGLT